MKLLIEFVSFNIYWFFIWETAGYATTRFYRAEWMKNSESEIDKVNIQAQIFWTNETLEMNAESSMISQLFSTESIERKCQ